MNENPYVTISVRKVTRHRLLQLCGHLRLSYDDLISMWVEDVEQQIKEHTK